MRSTCCGEVVSVMTESETLRISGRKAGKLSFLSRPTDFEINRLEVTSVGCVKPSRVIGQLVKGVFVSGTLLRAIGQ